MTEPVTVPDPVPATDTVSVRGSGGKHCENSDVLLRLALPAGVEGSGVVLVAVAVTLRLEGTDTATVVLKLALPDPSVVAFTNPRNCWPSPLPPASQVGEEKSSTRTVIPPLPGRLRVPWITVEEAPGVTAVILGALIRLLGLGFAATPCRSIPSPPLERMLLPSTEFPLFWAWMALFWGVVPSTKTASPPLN